MGYDMGRGARIRRVVVATLLALVLVAVLGAVIVQAEGAWMEVRYLRVLVSAIFDGDVTVTDDLTVTDDTTMTGDAAVGGDLDVTGAATVGSTLDVTGDLTAGAALDVTGDTTVGGTLDVTGITTAGVLSQTINTENRMLPTVAMVSLDIDNATSPSNILTVGDGEVWAVYACFANVLADFATGETNDAVFQVGDGTTANLFLDLEDAELQVADTDNGPAGWQGLTESTQGVGLDAGSGSPIAILAPSGADQNIVATFTGTGLAGDGTTAADIAVYMIYWRLN